MGSRRCYLLLPSALLLTVAALAVLAVADVIEERGGSFAH